MTHDESRSGTIKCAPKLPNNWREHLAAARQRGYPNSAKHQWAYRNFVRACFPTVDTTDPDVREQLDAWWVLMQLPYDGVWQYRLTAPACENDEVSLRQASRSKRPVRKSMEVV